MYVVDSESNKTSNLLRNKLDVPDSKRLDDILHVVFGPIFSRHLDEKNISIDELSEMLGGFNKSNLRDLKSCRSDRSNWRLVARLGGVLGFDFVEEVYGAVGILNKADSKKVLANDAFVSTNDFLGSLVKSGFLTGSANHKGKLDVRRKALSLRRSVDGFINHLSEVQSFNHKKEI